MLRAPGHGRHTQRFRFGRRYRIFDFLTLAGPAVCRTIAEQDSELRIRPEDVFEMAAGPNVYLQERVENGIPQSNKPFTINPEIVN